MPIKNCTPLAHANRIKNAKDENEMWKIINDMTKPNKENTWKLSNALQSHINVIKES